MDEFMCILPEGYKGPGKSGNLVTSPRYPDGTSSLFLIRPDLPWVLMSEDDKQKISESYDMSTHKRCADGVFRHPGCEMLMKRKNVLLQKT